MNLRREDGNVVGVVSGLEGSGGITEVARSGGVGRFGGSDGVTHGFVGGYPTTSGQYASKGDR